MGGDVAGDEGFAPRVEDSDHRRVALSGARRDPCPPAGQEFPRWLVVHIEVDLDDTGLQRVDLGVLAYPPLAVPTFRDPVVAPLGLVEVAAEPAAHAGRHALRAQ